MSVKKGLILVVLIVVIIISLAIFIFFTDKSQLITGFLGAENDPLDINQDGRIDQRDLDDFNALYGQKNLKADFDKNGEIEFNDLAEYVFLYRNK